MHSEESIYEVEDETTCLPQSNLSVEEVVPYTDDLFADAHWTAKYEQEMKENEELEQRLKDRLESSVRVDEW